MQIVTKDRNENIVYTQYFDKNTHMVKVTALLMVTDKALSTETDISYSTSVEGNGNYIEFSEQALDLLTLIKTANGLPVRAKKATDE